MDVNGDVTFEKPLSVTDTEGIGLHLLEEKGVLLSTENFPPIRSLTLTNNVKVVLNRQLIFSLVLSTVLFSLDYK